MPKSNFKKDVEALIESIKKTDELCKSILNSEITTDTLDGPFGNKKS